MFDTFVAPLVGWQPPRIAPARKPLAVGKSVKPYPRDWEDAALEGDWAAAVLGFLRERRREAVPYWEVVNGVAQASTQPDRWELRFATRRILAKVKELLHERKILRYRRRYLAVLDHPTEIVSLEEYRAIRKRVVTERGTNDSTTHLKLVQTSQYQT
jgi:hypothetical protein